MFKTLINRCKKRYYVIADTSDNSITFSEHLFEKIREMSSGGDVARVFVFFVPELKRYGFSINPDIKEETQIAYIQHNEFHRTIGFESLCPTVTRIFYDYRLPAAETSLKLQVRLRRSRNMHYFTIERPSKFWFKWRMY